MPLTERFALTLDGLYRAVAARIAGGAMAAAMIVLVCGRVRRVETRILGLLARFRAGRLWVRVATPRGPRRGGRGTATSRLPRRFGWLMPLVPFQAASFASQLRVVLDDPEMTALLEASAQARRVLAPLCRMLAMEHPLLGVAAGRTAANEALETVKRVRRKRPKLELGRIPLPRGVLTWARREGFGKVPRG